MSKNDNIIEELKELNSILAVASRQMPYEVDAGYFDSLSYQITDKINNEHIQDPILAYGRTMPYALPDNYFSVLPQQMTAAAKTEDFKAYISLHKTLPYTVSENYFAELPGHILSAAKVDDFITCLPKITPFTHPAGYFNELPEQMLLNAKSNDVVKKPKTIPLYAKPVRRYIEWAVAAMLVICFGLGTYRNFVTNKRPNPEALLASVSKTDISDYINMHSDEFSVGVNENNTDLEKLNAEVSQFDREDIIHYLDETGWDAVE